MIKESVKKIFNTFRYNSNHLEQSFTMVGALKRCIDRGVKVNTVIDVGASDGRWSEICMNFFPDARYLLIEAQEEHISGLELFRKGHSNVEYIIAAAGNRTGKIYFDNSGLFGGLASETPSGNHCIEIPVTTIDIEIDKRGLKPPFLIKLDTHGYEIPILEGALKTVKNSNLIVIETYNYKLTSDSLRYFEMSRYMENLGFSSIEIVDLMLRKKDNSFWQMDTFFIPSNSKEFTYVAYE
jgi:FkbM family methyltransferase